MASDVERPGVERPFALHMMSSKQPERAQLFLPGMESNHVDVSMHHQSEEERLANGVGQSDSRIVPQQPTGQVGETKLGNASEGKAAKLPREFNRPLTRPSVGDSVISRLNRITDRAKSTAGEVFNNLFSAITVDLLRQAFYKLERGKASGIDDQTVEQYEADLENNLQRVVTQLHRESYRPNPSLRVNIPKGKGQTRPLGIACVEDKLVQRAVVMILERIYEEDFLPISFGFRPGKSCHDALSVLGNDIATQQVNWVSDADIKGFLRHNLTQPIGEVWKTLNSKLRGHYQYYGINDNWPSLIKYQEAAKRFAYRWICRRSQKGRISLRAFGGYLKRNPLAGPKRLTDLISRGRTLANNGGSGASVDKW